MTEKAEKREPRIYAASRASLPGRVAMWKRLRDESGIYAKAKHISSIEVARKLAQDWAVENEDEINVMAAFALSELSTAEQAAREEERERCCKDVCIACRTGARLIHTDAGTYTHEEGYCAAAAIRSRG